MPHPVALANGTFHLNVRVPADLLGRLRGTSVTLPIDGQNVVVGVRDKVIVSLRTKDPRAAKERFTQAHAALARHWAAARSGPRPLTHRQVVALAGLAYRERVARDGSDPGLEADFAAGLEAWREILRDTRCGDEPQLGEPADARAAATLAHAYGERLPALQFVDEDAPELERLRVLYGPEVTSLLARNQLAVDEGTFGRLLVEVDRAAVEAAETTVRNLGGDYAPDRTAARFPPFETPVEAAPSRDGGVDRITFGDVAARWTEAHRGFKAASTLRRYGPSLNSFARYLGDVDVRIVTDEDVWRWAEHRRDHDGVAARTVNRNDLVAVSSVLSWATKRAGGKIRPDNPASGVRLDTPKVQTTRLPTFFDHEIVAILRAARAAKPDPRYPRASASRRWVPWICAYTGARVQEVCWLRKVDVWNEDGIWVVGFHQTKDGFARVVPLHPALLAEGLLEFWRPAPDGYLFVEDRPRKADATRSAPEQRASELAEWIRSQVALPPEVSPNHAWRHTFLTRVTGSGVDKRLANALAGHNRVRDASDGYIHPDVRQLNVEMMKLPAYNV